MAVTDNKKEREEDFNKLVGILDKAIYAFEGEMDRESKCYQSVEGERLNSVSFFLLNGAFASLVELKRNIEKRNIISSFLITRHLLELYSDFKLIFSGQNESDKHANAFWYFGELRNLQLNKSASNEEKEFACEKWKQYRISKSNKTHWSGLERTEVIRMAWNGDDSIYRILSAISHHSLLTQDIIFWNYSERVAGYVNANVNGSISMVDEIFKIAKEKRLCGIKYS